MENNSGNESNKSIRNRTNSRNNCSISNEKRLSLIRLVNEQGQSIKEASTLLEVNYSTAKTILKAYELTGKTEAMSRGGSSKTILTPEIINAIENIVTFNSQYTLNEVKRALQIESDNRHVVSISTINRCLQELRITMKLTHRELDRVNMPDKIEMRKQYAIWFGNYFQNDYSRVVFIDESGFNLHLKRSYGRSRIGTRAIVRMPVVRGRSISLIASLTIDGMGFCKTISNSTVNSDIFNDYVDELCRYLRDVKRMNNACLILDNARIHRKNDIQRITTQYGFTFKFLSPYSYMLNPIENSFSKIKNCLRSKLRQGATGTLSELIMAETTTVTFNDCSGYFHYILRNLVNAAAGVAYVHQ